MTFVATTEPMNLASEYQQQFRWRDWSTILDALPQIQGQTILDLGCGVGDLAAEFIARGATVIGIDSNEELLCEARSRQLPRAEFLARDLRTLPKLDRPADGLWASFVAAYFPDLPTVLTGWARTLKPGGWIALTEIDDLFGHEPLSTRTRELFTTYAEHALAARWYDFHMGRKLQTHLEQSGFAVTKTLILHDQELSFNGPAPTAVLEAWRARFNRMKALREFCGPEFNQLQEDFLACLNRPDHTSLATVYSCIATI